MLYLAYLICANPIQSVKTTGCGFKRIICCISWMNTAYTSVLIYIIQIRNNVLIRGADMWIFLPLDKRLTFAFISTLCAFISLLAAGTTEQLG